jgi:hypothetical protein
MEDSQDDDDDDEKDGLLKHATLKKEPRQQNSILLDANFKALALSSILMTSVTSVQYSTNNNLFILPRLVIHRRNDFQVLS